jgi:UDPglucose--hexose-1-phosphate uridylyltransferase
MLHTAPLHDSRLPHFHWHLEIIPKLTKVAGFEWGSGFFINPTPPEDAARTLRDLVRVMDVPEGHLLANPAPGAGGD